MTPDVVCGAVSEHGDVCGLPPHDVGLCQSDGPRKRASSPEKADKPWLWYRDAAVCWNTVHPVGTPVLAWPGTRDDEPLTTRTRTRAWTLGHGAAVVSVEGRAGGIALTHIQVIEPSSREVEVRGDIKAAPLPYHPDPPKFTYSAYGVSVEFGEDHLMAQGHQTPQRFFAALNKVARTKLGLVNAVDDLRVTYAELARDVRHVWAYRLPKCDCTREQRNEYGACENLDGHDSERDGEFWRISWGSPAEPVTESTPGALPFTVWSV